MPSLARPLFYIPSFLFSHGLRTKTLPRASSPLPRHPRVHRRWAAWAMARPPAPSGLERIHVPLNVMRRVASSLSGSPAHVYVRVYGQAREWDKQDSTTLATCLVGPPCSSDWTQGTLSARNDASVGVTKSLSSYEARQPRGRDGADAGLARKPCCELQGRRPGGVFDLLDLSAPGTTGATSPSSSSLSPDS